jgi:hypothetical protein
MQTSDIPTLRLAAETFGIKLPTAVKDAEALLQAAADLVATVEAEQAPDPEQFANPAQLKRVYQALVEWDSHPARQAHARTVHALAESKRLFAWKDATGYFLAAFQEPFTTAAAAFQAALVEAGGTYEGASGAARDTLDDLAVPLEQLATVRRVLGTEHPVDLGNNLLPAITQLARFDTLEDSARFHLRTGDHKHGSAAWFAAIITAPGMTLSYQLPDQQQSTLDLATAGAGSRERTFSSGGPGYF